MDTIYDYNTLTEDIAEISKKYPFIEVSVIGRSVNGRNIYCLRLGEGEKQVFYNASHHALEWITSKLMMKFVRSYCESYVKGLRLGGYNIRRLYKNVSIYVVAMVNPDGIEIAKETPDWQANARGVDLNHNYDAGWYEYKKLADSRGITKPCNTRYPGTKPESEPESSAIANFTRRKSFEYVLAFHSQGKVIYWQYGEATPPKTEYIGSLISESSGYKLDQTEDLASYSGYKDWFIKEFGHPGYTIEVGEGVNPLPLSQFDEIYKDILEMLVFVEIIT